ncbi:MAG: acetyltransferase [bacterium]|nr:acetyltransferase [bacterium]
MTDESELTEVSPIASLPVLLFPFGGNAREAAVVIAALNRVEARYRVLGFLDDDPDTHGRSSCGLRVLGGRELLARHPEAGVLAVPGSPATYRRRSRVITSLELDRERFLTIIHPSVTIADDAVVGFNTLIMQGCTVSVDARVGNHCVILPNSVISHDARVADGTQVGSNVSISGGVRIGRGCYIGSGSCFREGVTIGDGSLIGLGSVLVRDVESDVVAVGNPARKLRSHA